jgi:hypothetical protein
MNFPTVRLNQWLEGIMFVRDGEDNRFRSADEALEVFTAPSGDGWDLRIRERGWHLREGDCGTRATLPKAKMTSPTRSKVPMD